MKNSRNISMDKNEDNVKNKLIRNVEVTNKVQKKRRRPRKIIQEIKLQGPMKRRGIPREVINKSPGNDKKRKFMESEDESDSDPEYDVKTKQKANKKKKQVKENEDEELKEESYFESNSDLSSEDEKEEETQENLQNVGHESENEQLGRLVIENSQNSDEDHFTEERPLPEPPPDQPSTSGSPKTQKNII